MRLTKKQRKFDELMERLKRGEFKYVPGEEKEMDWSSYDEAQVNEINDMLLIIRDAVEEAVLRLGMDEMLKNAGPGRPQNHPADLAKAVLVQQYFQVSNRVAAGLVRLFMEKMRIKESFSYKTIERAYEDPLVTLILREIFRLTQMPVRDKEHEFSADGSGLPTSMKQNYENDARSEKAKHGYEKMIAMVGGTYKLIAAVELTEEPEDNESPYFENLLRETATCYMRVDLVTADSAYLSRDNCDLIASTGALPRIHPKTRNNPQEERKQGMDRHATGLHRRPATVAQRVPQAQPKRDRQLYPQTRLPSSTTQANQTAKKTRSIHQDMRLQPQTTMLPQIHGRNNSHRDMEYVNYDPKPQLGVNL